jgi:hypothetical protein
MVGSPVGEEQILAIARNEGEKASFNSGYCAIRPGLFGLLQLLFEIIPQAYRIGELATNNLLLNQGILMHLGQNLKT